MAYLCGIDEAGRGPLAGPVVAGAVILPAGFPIELLNDSKKLSEKKRLLVEPIIKEKALAWGIGSATHQEIDKINILEATLLAMRRAFDEMVKMLEIRLSGKHVVSYSDIYAIIDGISYPDIPVESKAEPKADGKYPEVMAASILAKNYRDRLMVEYSKLYPEYGYEKHKGYPVPQHKEVCRTLGPSPIQRLTFKY